MYTVFWFYEYFNIEDICTVGIFFKNNLCNLVFRKDNLENKVRLLEGEFLRTSGAWCSDLMTSVCLYEAAC